MTRLNTEAYLEQQAQHVAPCLFKYWPKIVIAEGKGCILRDVEGHEFLDFTSGISVSHLGHSHPEIVAAVISQASKLMHVCAHLATYPTYIEFASNMKEVAPGDLQHGKVFLCNSGAEAAEAALKAARQFKKRLSLLAFQGGFHGRTLGTTAITSSKDVFRAGFLPILTASSFVPYAYCYRCPFNQQYPDCGLWCVDYIETAFKTFAPADDIAGMIIEPIQGEAGIITPPREYLNEVKNLCEKYNLLFIADEIWTCLGRTGKMFACEHFGVVPDIMTFAKSAGGGLPLGGIVAKQEIMDSWGAGRHGTTFGGNPVSCAAGIATIRTIRRERLCERAAELGSGALKRLVEIQDKHPIVGDVRGKGLMIGIELVENEKTKLPLDKDKMDRLISASVDKGVLFLPGGTYSNVLRMAPPLVVTWDQIETAMETLDSVLTEIEKT